MHKCFPATVLAAVLVAGLGAAPAPAADDYNIDAMHSGVNFKISHLGLSWVPGRFNDYSGSFTIDPDPSQCSFNLTIKPESIDTNNAKRDEHLRSPDFFNAKQFPVITFKSTSVAKAAVEGSYLVAGDLTLHGVTKPVNFTLVGGRKAEFPKGVQRTGFSTELTIKRADYGMDKGIEAVGNEVYIAISFEGVKK